jgi:hypothetical protein
VLVQHSLHTYTCSYCWCAVMCEGYASIRGLSWTSTIAALPRHHTVTEVACSRAHLGLCLCHPKPCHLIHCWPDPWPLTPNTHLSHVLSP